MKAESSKKEKKRFVRRVGKRGTEDLGPKENVPPQVSTPDLLLEVCGKLNGLPPPPPKILRVLRAISFASFYWWLIIVTLVVAFGFLPQNLGR